MNYPAWVQPGFQPVNGAGRQHRLSDKEVLGPDLFPLVVDLKRHLGTSLAMGKALGVASCTVRSWLIAGPPLHTHYETRKKILMMHEEMVRRKNDSLRRSAQIRSSPERFSAPSHGAYPIDWHRLIIALCPTPGDRQTLAKDMRRAGVKVAYPTITGWARTESSKHVNPHGDAAVWLYLEALRLGIPIPER